MERDVGLEVARVLVHPFQSRHQGISHLKRQSQSNWNGRSSVLHKNNPTYSFLFEGFSLWKHVLCKYIEIDKSRPSFSMTLYLWTLSVESALYHASGAWNFEVAPIFLENLHTSGLYCKLYSVNPSQRLGLWIVYRRWVVRNSSESRLSRDFPWFSSVSPYKCQNGIQN